MIGLKMKKLLSVVSSVALVVGMMPLPAYATQTTTSSSSGTVAAAAIEGTEGVDYVAGEVLVAVRGGQQALEAEAGTSWVARLSGASDNQVGSSSFDVEESLASVSADDLSNATSDLGTTDNVKLASTETSADTSSDDIVILRLTCSDTAQTIADLMQLDCVVAAEPNYYVEIVESDETTDEQVASAVTTATQNTSSTSLLSTGSASLASENVDGTSEALFNDQWSLQNGATLAANGYSSSTTSLNAQDAWANGAGNEAGGEVVVAVVDSGVDYTHQDLVDNMWTGGDAAWSTALGGGTYGYNGLTDNLRSDPMDTTNGHGTHCASTIAASWNNVGIAGVNNKVKIMAIRCIPTKGTEATASSILLGYNYLVTAKENGVNVVAASNSWGGSSKAGINSTLLESIIYKAGEDGIISVFAAGNSAYDNDLVSGAAYESANPYVLEVGAINSVGQASNFTQYGEMSVDVFSPGTQVLAAVSSYGANNDSTMYCNPQYLPWLQGTGSSEAVYFMDDAESATGVDGITYDLVAIDTTTFDVVQGKEVDNIRDTSAKGYVSNSSLKFNLNQTDASGNQIFSSTDQIAIRVNIPAKAWNEYKTKALEKGYTNVYMSMIGGYSGMSSSVNIIPLALKNSYWEIVGGGLKFISSRDGNWYALATQLTLDSMATGTNDNGDLQLLYYIGGACYQEGQTSFTDSDYVYLDNVSFGYAVASENEEGQVDDTYYYMDGTSMATPNTTGVVSLLSSHAAAISPDSDSYLQTAETAREIVSFIKGGVTTLDSIQNKCETGGVTNASTSYAAYKNYKAGSADATDSLHPVLDRFATNSDGTISLYGSFFGDEEGTLTFDGTALTVKSWTDSCITFEGNPFGKEHTALAIVSKANGVDGQNYLVMPEGSQADGVFSSLPTPDFTITMTNRDNTGVDIVGNASQVVPSKMVSAGGYIYLLGAIDNACPVLLRYDVAAGTWDKQNYFEGSQIDYTGECAYSWSDLTMCAGKTEIYIRVMGQRVKDGSYVARLLTVDAATGTIKYDVDLPISAPNFDGSMVCYNNELLFVGGKQGEAVYSAIYPDTGKIYRTSDAKLSTGMLHGTANVVAVNSSLSLICVTGSYTVESAVANYKNGSINPEIVITLNGETKEPAVSTSANNLFFDATGKSAYELDPGQNFNGIAATAIDGKVLLAGPVRNNEQTDMRDIWSYNLSTDKWSSPTLHFAATTQAALGACVLNGYYYVMGIDRSLDQSEVFQTLQFGCYPLSKLEETDTLTTAAATDAVHEAPLKIAAIADQIYTGSSIEPALTVTVDGVKLSADDYDVSYSNNKSVGTASVTVAGKGAYAGKSAKQTFNIVSASLSSATIEDIDDQTWTGSEIKPSLVVKIGDTVLGDDDYAATYKANTEVGTATVTLTGKGDYAGTTASKTFKIVARQISDATVAAIPAQTYSGDPFKPVVELTYGGAPLKEDVDYTVAYYNNINAGTATVVITGIGPNYAGYCDVAFEILPADISVADVTVPDMTYTGSELTPSVTVATEKATLVEGVDYTVTFAPSPVKEVGTYTATITGKGSYTGTKDVTFKVAKSAYWDEAKKTVDEQVKADKAAIDKLVNLTDAEKAAYKSESDKAQADANTAIDAAIDAAGVDAAKVGGIAASAKALAEAEAANNTARVTVWRLYNASTGEHLWTADANEYQVLTGYGWTQEGGVWSCNRAGKAVYRLYNASLSMHLYTTDENEAAVLSADYGWNNEGVVFYAVEDGAKDTIAVKRLYNASTSQHLLTTDEHEASVLSADYGWTRDGVAFNVFAIKAE